MSMSTAIMSYCALPATAVARWELHTPRFPISSKHPPSTIRPNDEVMKSAEREFSTACSRPPSALRDMPKANAPAVRDERVDTSTPSTRTSACLYGCPTEP
eukprot:4783957-Prymnesium_polylepis.1